MLTASALGVVVEAHLAKTDAALLAAVVAGQGALGLVYVAARAGRRSAGRLPLVFWLAEAVAILLKGPPGPVLGAADGGCAVDRRPRLCAGSERCGRLPAVC